MGGRDAYPTRRGKRSYDFKPATVGTSRAIDDHTIQVHCNACLNKAIVSLEGMPEDQILVEIPRACRLVCSKCGSRDVSIMTNVSAHYDKDRVKRGLTIELPSDRHVLRVAKRIGLASRISDCGS